MIALPKCYSAMLKTINSGDKLKVAIYIRVSTQDQNLDNQLIPLSEYCKRMGHEYEVFQEKESTRKKI